MLWYIFTIVSILWFHFKFAVSIYRQRLTRITSKYHWVIFDQVLLFYHFEVSFFDYIVEFTIVLVHEQLGIFTAVLVFQWMKIVHLKIIKRKVLKNFKVNWRSFSFCIFFYFMMDFSPFWEYYKHLGTKLNWSCCLSLQRKLNFEIDSNFVKFNTEKSNLVHFSF